MAIAELNIGILKHDTDDPRVAPFMRALDAVNAIAERSPGFLWRLKGDNNNATGFKLSADPRHIPNLSVWTDVDALGHFVFNTVHRRFYERRSEWFTVFGGMHFVMWPVADTHRPDLAEAMAMLERLQADGPSADVFDWKSAPASRNWTDDRCRAIAAE